MLSISESLANLKWGEWRIKKGNVPDFDRLSHLGNESRICSPKDPSSIQIKVQDVEIPRKCHQNGWALQDVHPLFSLGCWSQESWRCLCRQISFLVLSSCRSRVLLPPQNEQKGGLKSAISPILIDCFIWQMKLVLVPPRLRVLSK